MCGCVREQCVVGEHVVCHSSDVERASWILNPGAGAGDYLEESSFAAFAQRRDRVVDQTCVQVSERGCDTGQ